MDEVLVSYRIRPLKTALLAAGYLGCALFLINVARHNDRGLIINHLIPLGIGGATILYWILAVGALALTLACVAGVAISRRQQKRHLIFGDAALTIPIFRRREPAVIDYRDITGLRSVSYSWIHLLHIDHYGGKFTICAELLPRAKDLNSVAILIAAKVRAARG